MSGVMKTIMLTRKLLRVHAADDATARGFTRCRYCSLTERRLAHWLSRYREASTRVLDSDVLTLVTLCQRKLVQSML